LLAGHGRGNPLSSRCAVLPAATRKATATLCIESGQQRTLVPRLHPRFAVSWKTATQRHSPSGVNRPLRARFNITGHSAKPAHSLRCASLGGPAPRCAGPWRVRGTRRYVWRPCAPARPYGAPRGAWLWSGSRCALLRRVLPRFAVSRFQSTQPQPQHPNRINPSTARA
jgi:hypothetical protein